ncbi:hypothetical protein ABIE27_002003 [Paenibacillus sp. 4624]|uniref:hypothetical protein n=1 Tax=Paenibacillus sp. 4624 TaxID=3156453 RepID=UPI003D1C79EB
MKKLASGLIAGALLLSLTAGVASADSSVHTLSTVPPTSSNVIVPFGANEPGINASTHNLSTSSYNYQVTRIGAKLYTEKWLTGSSTMKVTVENVENVGSTPGALSGVNVAVYKNQLVSIKNISKPTRIGSVSFSGLDSSKKYYVEFTVPTSGRLFSFNGTISQ